MTAVGDIVRIKGERGTYKVKAIECNEAGKWWVMLWGGPMGQYRHVRPENVFPVKAVKARAR